MILLNLRKFGKIKMKGNFVSNQDQGDREVMQDQPVVQVQPDATNGIGSGHLAAAALYTTQAVHRREAKRKSVKG